MRDRSFQPRPVQSTAGAGQNAVGRRGFLKAVGAGAGAAIGSSDRWIAPEYHERPREILQRHFPDLAGAPINETRFRLKDEGFGA